MKPNMPNLSYRLVYMAAFSLTDSLNLAAQYILFTMANHFYKN